MVVYGHLKTHPAGLSGGDTYAELGHDRRPTLSKALGDPIGKIIVGFEVGQLGHSHAANHTEAVDRQFILARSVC